MSGPAYYNEIDPYAAQWLRNLIAEKLIPAGDVDERSIVDVHPSDLRGYRQCHFFAGIGGWALAARLAGWPDDRELWTGSCPCQPFSVAGKQRGTDDERHLWPHQFRLIRARRPAVWMGEQVAAAVGKHWLDGVLSDLEGVRYAGRATVVPACAVDGPHGRDRIWCIAERDGAVGDGLGARLERLAGNDNDPRGRAQPDRSAAEAGGGGDMADSDLAGTSERWEQRSRQQRRTGGDPQASDDGDVADRDGVAGGQGCALERGRDQGSDAQPWSGPSGSDGSRSALADSGSGGCPQGGAAIHAGQGNDAGACCLPSPWQSHAWIIGHDGKARRIEPSIRLLAHGVPARVGRLRAYGNAIVPHLAAQVIAAYMDVRPALAANDNTPPATAEAIGAH